MITIEPGATVLFQGDSITDAGRDRADPHGLGEGYVAQLAELLPDVTVLNRGVSGNRAADLVARWQQDCLDLRPDVVSIMVGVNDTWRRYDADDPTSTASYEASYRQLLEPLAGTTVVLVEPFLLPVTPAMWSWREDLDPRISTVRRLAADYGAQLLAADGLLAQAAANLSGPEAVAADGVHPTPLGHELLAAAWHTLVSTSD